MYPAHNCLSINPFITNFHDDYGFPTTKWRIVSYAWWPTSTLADDCEDVVYCSIGSRSWLVNHEWSWKSTPSTACFSIFLFSAFEDILKSIVPSTGGASFSFSFECDKYLVKMLSGFIILDVVLKPHKNHLRMEIENNCPQVFFGLDSIIPPIAGLPLYCYWIKQM